MNGAGLLNAVPAGMPWAGALIAIGVCLGMLIKAWSVLRKVELDGGASLRTDLLARIAKLEARTEELERLLGQEQQRHAAEQAKAAAEISDLRHDLANETASLDAFLLLAEKDPAGIVEQIPTIREMRRQHRERVALKRGVREGAVIAAAQGTGD